MSNGLTALKYAKIVKDNERYCACKCGNVVEAARLALYPQALYVDHTHKYRAQKRRYRRKHADELRAALAYLRRARPGSIPF